MREDNIIRFAEGINVRQLLLYIPKVVPSHEGRYHCQVTITPHVAGIISPVSAGNIHILSESYSTIIATEQRF